MINTEKKINVIGILVALCIALAIVAALLWVFLLDGDKQQNKTYSGAKLVDQRECYIEVRNIL